MSEAVIRLRSLLPNVRCQRSPYSKSAGSPQRRAGSGASNAPGMSYSDFLSGYLLQDGRGTKKPVHWPEWLN